MKQNRLIYSTAKDYIIDSTLSSFPQKADKYLRKFFTSKASIEASNGNVLDNFVKSIVKKMLSNLRSQQVEHEHVIYALNSQRLQKIAELKKKKKMYETEKDRINNELKALEDLNKRRCDYYKNIGGIKSES